MKAPVFVSLESVISSLREIEGQLFVEVREGTNIDNPRLGDDPFTWSGEKAFDRYYSVHIPKHDSKLTSREDNIDPPP